MAAAQLLFSLFLYALGGVVVGLAIYPGVLLTAAMWHCSAALPMAARLLVLCIGIGLTYFIYGFMLLILTGLLFRLMGLGLRPGAHPFLSAQTFKWVLGSALGLVVKVTFMDFLALSPFLTAWMRVMGARIGHGVMVNTRYVHDFSLLEIGDGSVIGGEAIISCHVAEKNQIVLKTVRIGRKVLIGQRAIIMPGAQIGDGAVIGAQALVLKDAVVPAGEVWIGIPARKMESVAHS